MDHTHLKDARQQTKDRPFDLYVFLPEEDRKADQEDGKEEGIVERRRRVFLAGMSQWRQPQASLAVRRERRDGRRVPRV